MAMLSAVRPLGSPGMTGSDRPRSPFSMMPGAYSLNSTHRFWFSEPPARAAAKRFAQCRSVLRAPPTPVRCEIARPQCG